MAQLMPLPLTVSCFSKMQTGITFWVVLQKGLLNGCVSVCVCASVRACVSVCVCVCVISTNRSFCALESSILQQLFSSRY